MKSTIAVVSTALVLPLGAFGTISGITSLTLSDPPTVDLLAPDFAVAPNGSIRAGTSALPDISGSDVLMTGFSTAFGNVRRIRGPVGFEDIVTFPAGLEPPMGDTVRNVWGFAGPEVAGGDAILGTNVGAGLDNAGATGDPDNPVQPFKVFFADGVMGAAGEANDFFLLDIIGDDAVELRPLDANGEVIGDFVLNLSSGPGGSTFNNTDLGVFGLTQFELALFLENGSNIGLEEGTVIDDIPIAGTAFDIEDFIGTGVLNELYGFEITPLDPDESISSGEGSIDLLAIGYNEAAIPEPAHGAAVCGLLGLLIAGYRRWHK